MTANGASPGVTYYLEASEDLIDWVVIESVTADFAGELSFHVTQSPALYSRRFFRIALP
jgi:hypothetical protein